MSNFDIKQEFRREFDTPLLEAIGVAVSNAYRYLYELFSNEKSLKGLSGSDAKPHIRKVIVDFFLKQLESQGLDVECSDELNAGNNSWHIEIKKGRFIVTHNFVHDQFEHPRDSEFRKNLLLKNAQLSMEVDDNNVLRIVRDTEDVSEGTIYVQLIHGGKGMYPSFIRLCMPNRNGSEWFCIIDVPIVSHHTPTEHIPDPTTPPLKENKKTLEDFDE